MLGEFLTASLILGVTGAVAQEAEPRSYSNAPVGLNFLIAGFAHSEGKLAFDPSLSIADARFHAETSAVAYVRTLDLWGNSAKFDVLLPYSGFYADADVAGVRKVRQMSGMGDPRFRLAVNWVGAPALSPAEFENYKQDLIIGTSLQVSAPIGQYDDTKLLNLGNNRWSIRPELGISKTWDRWTLEVAPSVTFFSDNTDFFNGTTFKQSPTYLVQAHLIYNFQSGVWVSMDGIYFAGGRTTVNAVRGNNEQQNTRVGLTLAMPVNRQSSFKIFASTGTSTRTGSEFSSVGFAWQYRWLD